MSISYLYTGEPMVGSPNDDFVIGFKGSTGTDNNTINGNGGDDLIIADSSDTWIPNASYLNGSIGTAFNLETLTSTWTTAENEMFGDSTIPHTTVMAESTIGQSEYYRVAVGAGQQITIDIDFASNTAIGNPRDLVVELQDSLGNIIATADDSLVTDGGLGSTPSTTGSASSYDPYLVYTVTTGGIYYINVRPFGGGPGSTFTDNNTFLMNVSVTGHAVNATNPVQGIDTVNGGDGDDTIFGQGGNDVINGGIGNDTIDAGSGGDIVHGDEGNDILYGGDGSEENIHGDAGDDILHSGGEGHYYGDEGNDTIYAGLTSGINEVLDGGAGVDTLDTRTWNGAYTINLAAGTTSFGETFINFENVITGNGVDDITGTAGANTISTNAGADIVHADAGDDNVAGGADGDTLDGGADFDILNYRLSSGAVTINLATDSASGGHAAGDIISNFEGVWGSVLGDTLTGDDGNNELRGFEGNDVLVGGAGNDILDGGINDDTMTGGTGDDTYYLDSAGDIINELAGEGNDTIAVAMSYTLAAGSTLENLATIDPNAATTINLTGNSGINALTGNAGENTLNGGSGADTMSGLGGDDKYYVDNAGDLILEGVGDGFDRVRTGINYALAAGSEIEQLSTLDAAGITTINLTGNEFDNSIIGNAGINKLVGLGGNDTLDGRAGADTMKGGLGDDTYIVDDAGDVVAENSGEGTDLVMSSIAYTLASSIENLTLTGAFAINGTGNSLGNVIIGNDAGNIIDGMGGADTMMGGLGDDTYIVSQAGDVVTEGAAAGTDVVQSSVTFILGANVEKLILTGASTINGTGNTLDNAITGNDAANIIDGMAGADTMIGGLGDDTYVVDSIGDIVTEGASAGNDLVKSAITYTLGANLENLRLTGSSAINGTGNALNNVITGNDAPNIIDGMAGADTMKGGLGDDTYVVDNAGDVVGEDTAAGTDLVKSAVTFSLGGNIENLRLTGSSAINATGNSLNNVITGNSAANIIDGGGGADTMKGDLGNDTYIVAQAGDVVSENSGAGTDLVMSSISFALGGNVENLTLTGASAIDGTGNSLDNIITGNDAANSLVGAAGTDTLSGGGGDDILDGGANRDFFTGGTGADTFVFEAGDTAQTKADADKIDDFSTADGDKIDLHLIDADTGTAGNGTFNFIGTSAFSNVAGELRYEEVSGATFVFGDMNGDGVADMVVRLTGSHALASTDFVL